MADALQYALHLYTFSILLEDIRANEQTNAKNRPGKKWNDKTSERIRLTTRPGMRLSEYQRAHHNNGSTFRSRAKRQSTAQNDERKSEENEKIR